MEMTRVLMAVLAVLTPAAAFAQTTIALTPDQAEAAKEAGARAHARDAGIGLDPGTPGRQIHGEVGVTIGTGGYRALYGTAVSPLGQTGVVAISVATEQGGQPYRRYRR